MHARCGAPIEKTGNRKQETENIRNKKHNTRNIRQIT